MLTGSVLDLDTCPPTDVMFDNAIGLMLFLRVDMPIETTVSYKESSFR